MQYAEQQARALRVELDKGKFDWAEWQLSQAPKPETVSDWVEKFETEYCPRRSPKKTFAFQIILINE